MIRPRSFYRIVLGIALTGAQALCATALLGAAAPSTTFVDREIGPASTAPAGPRNGDLAVALTAPANAAYTGRPLVVTIELRNLSSDTLHFSGGSFNNIVFNVTNAETGVHAVRNPAVSLEGGSTRGGGIPLTAGSSWFERVQLSDLYTLPPGTYIVSLTFPAYIVDANDRRMPQTLQSNAIVLRVIPAPADGTMDPHEMPSTVRRSSNSPAGPRVAGLEVSLTSEAVSIRSGQAIVVNVELRNTQSRSVRAFQLSEEVLDFRVADASKGALAAQIVKPAILPNSSAGSEILIRPGSSEWARIVLSDLFDMRAPRVYEIAVSVPLHDMGEAENPSVTSNEIAIQVLP